MKILNADINKTVSEYRQVVSKLGEFQLDLLNHYFSELPNISNEMKSEMLTVLTSASDLKPFSTYENDETASLILSIMEYGILPILDMDDSYDAYSFYNNELWVHKVDGDWTHVDNGYLSQDLENLLRNLPFVFKNHLRTARRALREGQTRNTLLSISHWKLIDDAIFGTGWTIQRDMPSISEKASLFETIYTDMLQIEPEIVEAIVNDIKNEGENWNVRYGLMIDVTDVTVYPNTPIPYDLVSGFQFIQWLILKVKFNEK